MTSLTLKIEISIVRIDPWIVEDWSSRANKIKFWFKSIGINFLMFKDQSLKREESLENILVQWSILIEKIDPFISIKAFLRFLRFGILIFVLKIDSFLLRINLQDLDFTLSLKNVIFREKKGKKLATMMIIDDFLCNLQANAIITTRLLINSWSIEPNLIYDTQKCKITILPLGATCSVWLLKITMWSF